MATTFTKLKNGSWGVRVPSENVRPGTPYVVQKKGGGTSRVTIAHVLWSGNGVSICTIEEAGYSKSSEAGYRRRGYGPGRCHECGEHLESWMDGYHAGLCHDCI